MKSKIIAITIATLMLTHISSLAATDKLTYEAAVNKAIKSNLQLERANETIDDIEDILTQGISTNTDNIPKSVETIIGQSIQYQSLLDNEKLAKMQYDTQKEAIEIGIKNIFLNIQQLEQNEYMLEKKIENLRKNTAIDQVRYKKGTISKIDFENNDIELEKMKNMQKENKLQLEIAYKDLNNIMNTKNDKKIQYLDIDYATMSDSKISKESAIGKAIEQAPVIYQQNIYIKELEERLKYNLFDNTQTSLPKEEMSTNVKIQDVNLRINKQAIEDAVLETANSIENLEINIKNMQNQVKTLQRQSKNIEKLAKLGYKTNIELENINIKIEELNLNIQNLINTHHILLERYKKPYLLSIKG